MNSNQKRFGIYVFLSTFSRNLIEVFIPVILYKYGYSIKEIVFYYLIANVVSLFLSYPFVYLSKKFNNKILTFIGILAFLSLQILLNYMTYSIMYLLIIAILFAIYRRGYWISRRYYNLKVIKKDNISTTYSIISIINQIGVLISAYLGSVILDYVGLQILTIFAIALFVISLIPLHLIKFTHEYTNQKLHVAETLSKIPKKDLYLFGSYELMNLVKFLIPVYLFIYVKNNYQTIGIVNLITNLSIMIFTYLFGKKLDNSKKNYISLSIALTVIVYVLKINFIGVALLIISFVEGFITKMYELSISKNFYTLSKKFEYNNYNLVYEITQNLFRSVITLILFISNLELKNMIYLTLVFILVGIFFNKRQVNESAEQ